MRFYPNDSSFFDVIEANSEDAFVFCAPETID